MKESTTAGYLTAERKSFHDITDRLMNVNLEVLSDLTKRMTEGERVKPETEEEKLCFKLINDWFDVTNPVGIVPNASVKSTAFDLSGVLENAPTTSNLPLCRPATAVPQSVGTYST